MEILRLRGNDVAAAMQVLESFSNNERHLCRLPSSDHLVGLLNNDTCYVLAALEEGAITGFILAYRFPSFYATENTAYLYDIEVLPAYRKRGIGKDLIRQLLTILRKDNVAEVWLGAAINNFPAQKLFLSTGAQAEETFFEYFYHLD